MATVFSDGGCVVRHPAFMPYGLYLDPDAKDTDGRMNNLMNFYHWCAARMLTLDRRYAKEILNTLGLRQAATDQDRAQIALSYHCVSLTDVHWVREAHETQPYSALNLYQHSLSDAFVDVSLLGRTLTAENAKMLNKKDSAGDVSTSGLAPKAWIRREGAFFLLKDGAPEEVEAELLASKIARCFDVPQVLYEPMRFKGQKVSACRLMTSLETGIVPAEHIEIYAQNHGTTLQRMALGLDSCGYHMMNIIDYLVGNTDRHWGNWGFWVDHRTNRLIRLHPLMDFNKAFTAYDTLEGARCLTAEERVSQRQAACEGARRVGLNQSREVRPEWFPDPDRWEMFENRLALLRRACEKAEKAAGSADEKST